ncbi:type I restriction-modification system subunit M N-terminal domain-containing protein, partial [Acinetobacter baumannii]|nr:type I restriction-modification system subunit M N-terminal domain-containing protein [Acinetobacter baumannii]
CEEEIKKITIAANQDDVINALKEQIKNYFNKQQLDSKEKNSVIEEHEVLLESKKMTPLVVWYINNLDQVATFEKQMRRKVHFVIKPQYLWSNIYELARTQNKYLLKNLQAGFKFIENESFDSTFRGLFSEVNLDSDKLGKNYELRNTTLCSI